MKVLKEFQESHHYIDEWEKSKYFCPNCGKVEVWICRGGADFYQGEDYACSACGLFFTMPCFKIRQDAAYLLIIEQLKTGITKQPRTKRGN